MKILHYFSAFFVLAGVVHIGDILVTISLQFQGCQIILKIACTNSAFVENNNLLGLLRCFAV